MRGRFEGVSRIVRYNWPWYVGGALVASLGLTGWPGTRWAALAAGLLVLGSLAASYWIYDLSGLMRWAWVPGELGTAPRRWLNLHAGLDESSPALRELFPGAEGTTGDFYVAGEMTEPSLARARVPGAPPVDPARLPYGDGSFDAVFLLFAAHELRRAPAREAFFRELARVGAPGGRLLVVEHARDLANFLAFGPGFLHFLPAGEWRRLGALAGFEAEAESRRTPFVRVFRFRRAA